MPGRRMAVEMGPQCGDSASAAPPDSHAGNFGFCPVISEVYGWPATLWHLPGELLAGELPAILCATRRMRGLDPCHRDGERQLNGCPPLPRCGSRARARFFARAWQIRADRLIDRGRRRICHFFSSAAHAAPDLPQHHRRRLVVACHAGHAAARADRSSGQAGMRVLRSIPRRPEST